MNNPTMIKFQYSGDPWKVVDRWCSENGFKTMEASESRKTYQKGSGKLGPPVVLRVRHSPEETVLETCLIFGNFARAMALFMIPHEMGIESGGYHFWKDRGAARKKINQLLDELGQPNIT